MVAGPTDGVTGLVDGAAGPKHGIAGTSDGAAGLRDSVAGASHGVSQTRQAERRELWKVAPFRISALMGAATPAQCAPFSVAMFWYFAPTGQP